MLRKKIKLLPVLATGISPIFVVFSCAESRNLNINDADSFREAVNNKFLTFGTTFGKLTKDQAEKIVEKLNEWCFGDYKISFAGSQKRKISNDTRDYNPDSFILLISGHQKKLDSSSMEWHDITSLWYDEFENKVQSFVEAWNGVNEKTYDWENIDEFNYDTFKDVTAILTFFESGINHEKVGKLHKVANFHSKYQISDAALEIYNFDNSDVEDILSPFKELFDSIDLKEMWLRFKDDAQWQSENMELWESLDKNAQKEGWK